MLYAGISLRLIMVGIIYEGIFEDVFVHEHPELFVFDGTYTVSE